MNGRPAWLVMAIGCGIAGCGPGNGLTLGRVQGKITVEGEPVRWGRVLFVPDGSRGTEGPAALGLISREGTYSMATEESDDGVIVGRHKVGIIGLDPTPVGKAEQLPPPDPEDPRQVIASKVQRARQAQAEGRKAQHRKKGADVEERTMTTVDGKTYRIVVPDKVLKPETSGISVEVSRGTNAIDFDVKRDGTVEVRK